MLMIGRSVDCVRRRKLAVCMFNIGNYHMVLVQDGCFCICNHDCTVVQNKLRANHRVVKLNNKYNMKIKKYLFYIYITVPSTPDPHIFGFFAGSIRYKNTYPDYGSNYKLV